MEKSFTQRILAAHRVWPGPRLVGIRVLPQRNHRCLLVRNPALGSAELHGTKMLSPEATVQYSVDYLQKVAPDSRRRAVTLPDLERHPLLVLNWLDENNAQQFARLVPDGWGAK